MNRLCEKHERMILFDMHSYSDETLPPFARTPGETTPDLCIGTDPRFTPPRLTETVRRRFGEIGLSMAENRPYSGFYIPEDVRGGKSDCDFVGVMLEFNRRAYCDDRGDSDRHKPRDIKEAIRQIMADCVDL